MTSRSSANTPQCRRLPGGLSGPALRAPHDAGIRSIAELAQRTEREAADLHAMGPRGAHILKAALTAQELRFRSDD